MNLKQLSYFVCVVESGSVSQAANKLHMSQPPLSRHMKLLEEELQVSLFERDKNKLILTKAGEELYKRAYDLLEHADKTEKAVISIGSNKEKTLQIGCVSSSIHYIMHKDIANYLQEKHLKLSIREGNTFELLELLNHRMIDLAICRTPFSYQSFAYKVLPLENMVLISNSPLKESYIIKDLHNLPLIIYRRFKGVLEELFTQNDTILHIAVEVDDAKSAIMWATTNAGYAVVPHSVFLAFQSLGLYSAVITDDALKTNLVVIHRKDQKEKEILAFKDFLS